MVGDDVYGVSQSLGPVLRDRYGSDQGLHKEGIEGETSAVPCIDIIQGNDLFSGEVVLAIQGPEDCFKGVEQRPVKLAEEGG